MASGRQAKAWRAKGLCVNCGALPERGKRKCRPCLDIQKTYNRTYQDKLKQRAKGGNVEPQCQPQTGAIRAEHEWGKDGVCVRCKVPRPAGFVPAAAPEDPPAPRQPIIPSAADQVKRSPGPRGGKARMTDAQRINFGIGPRRPPAPVDAKPAPVAVVHGAEPADDVATIPDPLRYALNVLELRRTELDVSIATLRRLLDERKSA